MCWHVPAGQAGVPGPGGSRGWDVVLGAAHTHPPHLGMLKTAPKPRGWQQPRRRCISTTPGRTSRGGPTVGPVGGSSGTAAKPGWQRVKALEAKPSQNVGVGPGSGVCGEGPGPHSTMGVGQGGPGWISPIPLPRAVFKAYVGETGQKHVSEINAVVCSGVCALGNGGAAAAPSPGSDSRGWGGEAGLCTPSVRWGPLRPCTSSRCAPPALLPPPWAAQPVPCAPGCAPPRAERAAGPAAPWHQPTPRWLEQRPGELQLHPGRKPQGEGSWCPGTLGMLRSPPPRPGPLYKKPGRMQMCVCRGEAPVPLPPRNRVAPAGTSLRLCHLLLPSQAGPWPLAGCGATSGLSPDAPPALKICPGSRRRHGSTAGGAEPGSPGLGVAPHPPTAPTLQAPAHACTSAAPNPIPAPLQPPPLPCCSPPGPCVSSQPSLFYYLVTHPPLRARPRPRRGGSPAAGRLRHGAGRTSPAEGQRGAAAVPRRAAAPRREQGPSPQGRGRYRGGLCRTLPTADGDGEGRSRPAAPGRGRRPVRGASAGASAACRGRGAAAPCARPP